jgi:hypothetical protein
MLKPHSYGLGDDFMNVWEFDTDDYPVRHDKLAIALIAAGPNGNGINPVGGFVLSKFEAIFDEEESKSLNKKNGMLNAVFVMPADQQECIGLRYTISYDSKRMLYVNGKVIEKFSTD